MALFTGIYRGKVVDVSDPEKRGRYRVFCEQIHSEVLDTTDCYPWAELCTWAGKGFGDVPNYDVGDIVWIMFEAGRAEFPVITGGILTESKNIPDLSEDVRENYPVTRKKFQRRDRAGNLVEVSEVANELHVKLESGGATLLLSMKDNSIRLQTESENGIIYVQGARVNIESDQTFLQSQDIILQSTDDAGDVDIFSKNRVRQFATNEIEAGQFTQDGIPYQTTEHNLTAKQINVGQELPTPPRLATTQVRIAASDKIQLVCLADVEITSQGKTAITAQDDVTIDTTANVEITSTAETTINATGKVTVKSSSEALVDAPQVKVTGQKVDVEAALVTLGGAGALPVARLGDAVSVDPTTHVGTITTGSTKVMAAT